MGTTFTEGMHPGEYIVSEASTGSTGVSRSRDTVTVASGQNLVSGAVLGTVTASGLVAELDPAAADGTEVASGILFSAVDATSADTSGVAHVRDMEFNADEVTFKTGMTAGEISTALTQLKSLGVIAR